MNSQTVKQTRISLGLSKKQFANLLGITPECLYGIERGDIETTDKIVNVINVLLDSANISLQIDPDSDLISNDVCSNNTIKHIRDFLQINNKKFSEIVSCHPSCISNIEKGNRFISAETCDKICNRFGIEPSILISDYDVGKETVAIELIVGKLKTMSYERLRAFYKLLSADFINTQNNEQP